MAGESGTAGTWGDALVAYRQLTLDRQEELAETVARGFEALGVAADQLLPGEDEASRTNGGPVP